jgi:hypothetical protein
MVINQSEIISWLNHPVTNAIIKKLSAIKADEETALLSGAYLTDHDKTAYTIGFLAGLKEILEIKPEEVFKNENSEANRS